jgi:hypothetical protein
VLAVMVIPVHGMCSERMPWMFLLLVLLVVMFMR